MRRIIAILALALLASTAGLATNADTAEAFTYCGKWRNSGGVTYNSGYLYQKQVRTCVDSNQLSWTQSRTISFRA
jgi:hypothetical protein